MSIKVVPWDLPAIKGGTVGGFTPAPTPTPEEDPEDPEQKIYYDCENAVYVRNPAYGSKTTRTTTTFDLSGVVVSNLVGVVSAEIKIHYAYKTTQSYADAEDEEVYDTRIPITNLMYPNVSGRLYAISDNWMTSAGSGNFCVSFRTITLFVYGANGEVLQYVELYKDVIE